MLSDAARDGSNDTDSIAEIRVLLVETSAWVSDYLDAFGLAGDDSNTGNSVFREVDDSLAGAAVSRTGTAWHVVAAESTTQGLKACKRALRADAPFHVAFIDADLSGPESGITLAHRLRALDPRLFTVISGPGASWPPMAADAQPDWASKTLLLAKPFFGWEAAHAALHAKALWDQEASARGIPTAPAGNEPAEALKLSLAMARFDPLGQAISVNDAFLAAHPELAPRCPHGLSLRDMREIPPFGAISSRAGDGAECWQLVELPDGTTRAAAVIAERDGGHLLAEIDLGEQIERLTRLRRIAARDCAIRRWDRMLNGLASQPEPGMAGRTAEPRLGAAAFPAGLTPRPLHPGKAVGEAVDAVTDQSIDMELFESHRPWPAQADEAGFHAALSLLFQGLAENAGGQLTVAAETANVRLDEAAAAQVRCPAGDYVRIGLRVAAEGCLATDVEDLLDPLGLAEEDRSRRLGLLRSYAFARRSGGHMEVSREQDALRIDLLLPRAQAEDTHGRHGKPAAGSRHVA